MQFCICLTGLVRMEEMLRMMAQAMKNCEIQLRNRFRDCRPGVPQFAYELHERNKSYKWI